MSGLQQFPEENQFSLPVMECLPCRTTTPEFYHIIPRAAQYIRTGKGDMGSWRAEQWYGKTRYDIDTDLWTTYPDHTAVIPRDEVVKGVKTTTTKTSGGSLVTGGGRKKTTTTERDEPTYYDSYKSDQGERALAWGLSRSLGLCKASHWLVFISAAGDLALTEFPFYINNQRHWGIKGAGRRWEVRCCPA